MNGCMSSESTQKRDEHDVDAIIRKAVDVLKIEGRSKGADYVYNVVNSYKEAINLTLKDIDSNSFGNFSGDKVFTN